MTDKNIIRNIEAVEAFNYLFKIGDPIKIKYNNETELLTATCTIAFLIDKEHPVVFVRGIHDPINLSDVIIALEKKRSDLLGITYYVPVVKY